MTRPNLDQFTLGSNTYLFTPQVKRAIRQRTRQDNTLAVWFEGHTLHHTYAVDDAGDEVETESVDVIETFQTMPSDARVTLAEYGCLPISGDASSPFEGNLTDATVDLADWR